VHDPGRVGVVSAVVELLDSTGGIFKVVEPIHSHTLQHFNVARDQIKYFNVIKLNNYNLVRCPTIVRVSVCRSFMDRSTVNPLFHTKSVN